MPRFFGYMVLFLFLLCGVVCAAIYYGTFGPGGGRIDPRFVIFFKYLEWTAAYEKGTPVERRASADKLMLFGSSVRPPIFGVDSQDRTISGPGGAIPVRVYDPKTAAGDLRPLMIFLHGGGFFSGSVRTHDLLCKLLASRSGAVVVSVDYRLAPEHPFPAAFDDAYTALLWAHASAKELKADPSRLVVAGDSAGGNLAAGLAVKATRDQGPKVAYQFLIYPLLNIATFESESLALFGGGGFFISKSGMIKMREFYLASGADPKDPYVSPLLIENLQGLPPTLVVTAEFDPLRSDGEAFVDRLKAQGVNARAHRYPGMGHGFVSASGIFREADQAIDEIAATLKASL